MQIQAFDVTICDPVDYEDDSILLPSLQSKDRQMSKFNKKKCCRFWHKLHIIYNSLHRKQWERETRRIFKRQCVHYAQCDARLNLGGFYLWSGSCSSVHVWWQFVYFRHKSHVCWFLHTLWSVFMRRDVEWGLFYWCKMKIKSRLAPDFLPHNLYRSLTRLLKVNREIAFSELLLPAAVAMAMFANTRGDNCNKLTNNDLTSVDKSMTP